MKFKTTDDITLSDQISSYLKQESLSQHTLATKLSINKATLHNWINGVKPQALITLSKLADLLGVSIDELCFGSKAALRLPKEESKPLVIKVSLELQGAREERLIEISQPSSTTEL